LLECNFLHTAAPQQSYSEGHENDTFVCKSKNEEILNASNQPRTKTGSLIAMQIFLNEHASVYMYVCTDKYEGLFCSLHIMESDDIKKADYTEKIKEPRVIFSL
jgi:hypothetical protein